jgi:AmmeMemoRadiSam system protein B
MSSWFTSAGNSAASGSNAYVRRASHAGSWYTDDGSTLDGQLEEWLTSVQQVPPPLQQQYTDETFAAGATTPVRVPSRVRAIIAPHAGYSYSGPTAAHAYAHLSPQRTKVHLLETYQTCMLSLRKSLHNHTMPAQFTTATTD